MKFFISKSNKLPAFAEVSNVKNDPWAIIFFTYIISMTALPFLSLRVIFYAFILLYILYLAVFRNVTIEVDWFLIFLIFYFVLCVILSLFNGLDLEVAVGIAESIILIVLTLIFGVNRRAIVSATILILLISFFRSPEIIFNLKHLFIERHYDVLFVKTSHHLSFMLLIMAVYFMLLGKAKYSLLILILTIPIVSRSGLLAFSVVSILYYLRNYIPQRFIKILPSLCILGSLVMAFGIGIFYAQDNAVIIFTKLRSLLYEVIVNDLIIRGDGMLFPQYSGYTSDVIAEQLRNYFTFETPYYPKLLESSNGNCVHATFLELLSDYGAIFFLFFLFFFYKITNFTNVYIVLFYVVFATFQCEAFTPFLLFPFYIFYYLSTRLDYHGSNIKIIAKK